MAASLCIALLQSTSVGCSHCMDEAPSSLENLHSQSGQTSGYPGMGGGVVVVRGVMVFSSPSQNGRSSMSLQGQNQAPFSLSSYRKCSTLLIYEVERLQVLDYLLTRRGLQVLHVSLTYTQPWQWQILYTCSQDTGKLDNWYKCDYARVVISQQGGLSATRKRIKLTGRIGGRWWTI